MKRYIITLVAIIAAALVSCGDNATTANSTAKSNVSTESNAVDVLYMHGKQRCVTCVAIGDEASAVVKELNSDNVVMKTIDLSTPEGEKIGDKYEIASSSLIVVKGDKVTNLTAQGFRFARNNPEIFKKSLRETIQNMTE